jgi:hypothetical protein
MAWDFLNDNVYGDAEIERPAALPEFPTRQFAHNYRPVPYDSGLRALRRNRAVERIRPGH